MKSKKLSNCSYLIRLDRGDELFASLLEFAESYQKNYITFQGIGAVSEVVLSFFDVAKKSYSDKRFDGDFELTSLLGNITSVEKQSVIHAHAVMSGADFSAVSGHLRSAQVSVTVEIIAHIYDSKVIRIKDDCTGLNLIDLEDHGSNQPI